MKTNYFTKVEDKYVFNISLIFWHIFIILSSLAILISLAVLLWSLIPAQHEKVVKKPYPTMKQFPPPLKITLNELNLGGAKEQKAPHYTKESVQRTAPQQSIKDTTGKNRFENSLNVLKTLVPPTKYSWKGSGYWNYPYGERYWNYYKQERYRKWIVTKNGINDELNYVYRTVSAQNYTDKKQLLDGINSVIKLLPETERLKALKYLLNNTSRNIKRNLNVWRSLTNVVSKMKQAGSVIYINQLAAFGNKNPNDGSRFIDYTAKVIDNFEVNQRTSIINRLVYSYYNYFGQNFDKQQEATNLFLPLVAQINAKQQTKALMKYYGLYLTKNYNRNRTIDQIKSDHQQAINNINNQYRIEQQQALVEYGIKTMAKHKLRDSSLLGIAGGLVLIVLIAVILVFLSIQRSIKKIEEKIVTET